LIQWQRSGSDAGQQHQLDDSQLARSLGRREIRHTIKTVNKITILVRFWCSEVSLHIQEFSRILEFLLQAGGQGMLKKMAKMRAALKDWGPHSTN
jgi:hypothetical protein